MTNIFIPGHSTCLVVAWPSIPPSGPAIMASMCEGWRRCVALVMLDEMDAMDQEIGEPPLQLKYSLAVAWVMIKRVEEGFVVRLKCGQKMKHWMQYDEISNYASGSNTNTR